MGFDFERLGRRISEERKHFRKVSQEKMAEELGMYQADISNIERARKGSGITDLSRLDLIAEYLDIPLESLLFGTKNSSHTTPYYMKKMEIKAADPRKKIPAKHIQRLERLMGANITQLQISQYECGPYSLYVAGERQSIMEQPSLEEDPALHEEFFLWKLHTFIFSGDEVIASMLTDLTSVKQYIYGDMILSLQQLIQPDVLQPTDIRRRLNPFDPLHEFADGKIQKSDMLLKSQERLQALMKHQDLRILLIESAYVCEDCRRMGICRMMLDLLKSIFGSCILWLNLEPTSGEELSETHGYFPVYSDSDVGQLNINAAIAEKLGFTVDDGLWQRQVETVDSSGKKDCKVLDIRKCAYQMPTVISEIIKNDSNLVQLGRAQQTIAQQDDSQDSLDVCDFQEQKIGEDIVLELRRQTCGNVLYIYGVLQSDGNSYYAVSADSPIHTKLKCSEIAHYNSLECAYDSPYFDDINLVHFFMMGL